MQQEKIQNFMVCKTKTMLNIEREICCQVESQAKLDWEFKDKNDPMEETGKDQLKEFISKNIGEPNISLDHSNLLKKDSCCVTAYNAITSRLEKAKMAHKTWKRSMADLVIEIADSEIDARK